MAEFTGSGGSVTLETVSAGGNLILLHVGAWSFNWNREEHNVTEFDSTPGWKDKIPGLVKISGSLEGFYQDAAEDPIVASELIQKNIGLILDCDGTRKFTWIDSVNLTNLGFQNEVGVPSRWTCAFSASTKPTIA